MLWAAEIRFLFFSLLWYQPWYLNLARHDRHRNELRGEPLFGPIKRQISIHRIYLDRGSLPIPAWSFTRTPKANPSLFAHGVAFSVMKKRFRDIYWRLFFLFFSLCLIAIKSLSEGLIALESLCCRFDSSAFVWFGTIRCYDIPSFLSIPCYAVPSSDNFKLFFSSYCRLGTNAWIRFCR